MYLTVNFVQPLLLAPIIEDFSFYFSLAKKIVFIRCAQLIAFKSSVHWIYTGWDNNGRFMVFFSVAGDNREKKLQHALHLPNQ